MLLVRQGLLKQPPAQLPSLQMATSLTSSSLGWSERSGTGHVGWTQLPSVFSPAAVRSSAASPPSPKLQAGSSQGWQAQQVPLPLVEPCATTPV